MEGDSTDILHDIGEVSTGGVFVYDLSARRLEYVNQPFVQLTGIAVDKLRKNLHALKAAVNHDAALLEEQYETLRTTGVLLNLELQLANSGKPVLVDAYLLHRYNKIVVFVKDISKTKEHMDYITEFGARKNVMLDMIAHQLSRPLNMTYLLLDRIDELVETQQVRQASMPLRIIRENTQQCIDLIHSFINEEHILSPSISVAANRFDVLYKIKVAIEHFQQFAPGKQYIIDCPDKQLYAVGDDVKFFQIINNLVSNATKFTDPKGKIDITVRDTKTTLKIAVADNGMGIPDYLQPYIFDPHSKASRSGLRGEKSTGMGLYIVKKLVSLMDGTMTFASKEDEGSTFVIELPKHYRSRRSIQKD